jgi:branched-chain amino acid transport system permease protein
MQQFFQALMSGLAEGAIYASLALALVLIYKATEVINFAQGEMAMFTTYIAYALYTHSHFGVKLSYWWAFFATLVIAFVFGVGLQRIVLKPLEHASVLAVVMATIALLVILNGLAAWIWSPELKFFPSPFPTSTWVIGGVHISKQDTGTFGVTLACVVVLWLFFRFTKLGLAMRAGAVNPVAARLLGVRTSWLLALGWGFAAVLGAVSGMMSAPTNFLSPSMMQAVLIFAFAGAILGGLESPVGAVVGGLGLGVLLSMLGTYVHPVTPELRLPVALLILLVVLLVKPAGLFGRVVVRRV